MSVAGLALDEPAVQSDFAGLVSVVMIFLDAGRFIEEAIQSVLAQSYGRWELLLVDDGSSDESTGIARRHAQEHPERVRYLEHPGHENRGMSAARNLGLAEARGEFVAFLDADDVWLPNKLEEQTALLDAHPEAVALYGNSVYWYSWSGEPGSGSRDHLPNLGVPLDRLHPPPVVLLRALRGNAALPCPSSILARRGAIEEVGGFEEQFRGLFEDQVFYTKLLTAGPVYVADACWVRYRRHPASACAVAEETVSGDAEKLRYLRWARDYLAGRGQEGSEVWKVIDRELRRLRPSAIDRIRRLPRRIRQAKKRARRGAACLLPRRFGRRLLDGRSGEGWPPPGRVRFGDLRRVQPINRHWGWERGLPIDRFYVEQFLTSVAGDIRGRVLEAGDSSYTREFGGSRVSRADVLFPTEGNPKATVVADLGRGDSLPAAAFDCIILTQTLQLVYDVPAALRSLSGGLRPGGVLLVTVPGISQTTDEKWRDSWYWSFTVCSVQRLSEEVFPEGNVRVESHGNVLAATAFLHGLSREELKPEELAAHDPDFPLLITLRALKPLRDPGA